MIVATTRSALVTALAIITIASIDAGGFAGKAKAASTSRHTILVMVNDYPITKFNVEQRAALLSLQSNIGKSVRSRFGAMIRSDRTKRAFKKMQREVITGNPGKSREQLIKIFRAKQKRYALRLQKQAISTARRGMRTGLRSKALNELIEERLKIQAAKKVNIVIDDAVVDDIVKKMAARNKKTPKQFAANLRRMGAGISTMKSRMKANFAWRRAINRRFGALVSINDAQIDDTIAAASSTSTETNVELQLQRIVLGLPKGDSQTITAKRYQEAERILQRFRGCKSMNRLTNGISKASFKRLGMRNPSSFTEPTRTMLLTAGDNQMTPPTLGDSGIELYAVCGRRAGRGSDKQRAEARGTLRQNEFKALAKRHMRDLRTEAHICRRKAAKYAMTLPPCY